MENGTAYFVKKDSIVREIWGNSDTILLIFAGAAAEFALSKAVDWLYFTGKLPADPIGRLFSTVTYAQRIVFSKEKEAYQAIHAINSIHGDLEEKRGYKIPDWAYRDVLFMLIDYSIRSYEILHRPLTSNEKLEVLQVFNRLGECMNIENLPDNFDYWVQIRSDHLERHLNNSGYTTDLYQQYKKHLRAFRFRLLKEVQIQVVPNRVSQLMGFRRFPLVSPLISVYKLARSLKIEWILKRLLFPSAYQEQIKALDYIHKG